MHMYYNKTIHERILLLILLKDSRFHIQKSL